MLTSEKLLISVRRLLHTPISYGSLKFSATYLAKLPSPARPSSLLATLSARITQDSRANPFDCGIISISCEALSQKADFLIGLSPSRLSFSYLVRLRKSICAPPEGTQGFASAHGGSHS